MILLIKYELNKPNKDYTKLYEGIKGLGDWVRDPLLHSAWFVSTNQTALQAADILKFHIDADDRIFITRLHSNEYAGWMNKDIWNWINPRV
ncbi:MAG: hypothetical protein WCV55_01295 [Candidatus Paceibacterota bacterium]